MARISFSGLRSALPFSRLFREVEQDMETVVKILQPGPLGTLEHKFSADEIRRAHATVRTALDNWRRNAALHDTTHLLNDFIQP